MPPGPNPLRWEPRPPAGGRVMPPPGFNPEGRVTGGTTPAPGEGPPPGGGGGEGARRPPPTPQPPPPVDGARDAPGTAASPQAFVPPPGAALAAARIPQAR